MSLPSAIQDKSNDEEDESKCPYCGSEDTCPHHLLTVAVTDMEAQGGALYKKFDAAWTAICDASSPDADVDEQPDEDNDDEEDEEFDDRLAFSDLLDTVAGLSDSTLGGDTDGGPGMSTEFRHFFCSSAARVMRRKSAGFLDSQAVL